MVVKRLARASNQPPAYNEDLLEIRRESTRLAVAVPLIVGLGVLGVAAINPGKVPDHGGQGSREGIGWPACCAEQTAVR